jgi:hypothetical protein
VNAPELQLYWIPVGAGTPVVRASTVAYEALCAVWERRPRVPLFHAALIALDGDDRIVVEVAPVPDRNGADARGVVGGGPVGSRVLGGLRIFRYEVRRWRDGVIPDLDFAVASPVRLSGERDVVERSLALLAQVPTPTWGRDELGLVEMWNSNSVVAWVLARAGLAPLAGRPPLGGRAPGWDAGLRGAGLSRSTPTGSRRPTG